MAHIILKVDGIIWENNNELPTSFNSVILNESFIDSDIEDDDDAISDAIIRYLSKEYNCEIESLCWRFIENN